MSKSKFYAIHEGFYPTVADRLASLKGACMKFNLEFIPLDTTRIDYQGLPELSPDDGLYNVARGGELLETLLLLHDPKTFYIESPKFVDDNKDTIKYSILLEKHHLPAPKTIYHCLGGQSELETIVDSLNGFPVILKTAGGSTGIGTMLLSDRFALHSVVDYLTSTQTRFILREYIPPKEVARLIVVGNEVIASNKKCIPDHDFRTSVKNQLPQAKEYSPSINKLAVAAAHGANFTNAGVDILIDHNDQPFVLEVNMPHDFTTTELATGIDISGAMIKSLFGSERGLNQLSPNKKLYYSEND